MEVIGQYVSLQKRGRSFLGLCPFHDEKTPSFHVDPGKGMFYCFGCHAGGDVFSFLTRIENRGFMEVVRELAERAHVELPAARLSPEERQKADERERLLGVLEVAAGYYERKLLGSDAGPAVSYLQKRGISSEVAREFRLGFAPDGWQNLVDFLNRSNHPLFLAEKAGLIVSRPRDRQGYYDRFRARVMFPIRDVSGKVIGFGGRVLGDGEPKYLNSPETVLFNKSRTLFGLDLARRAIGKEDMAVVVEGNFDTISLHAAGVRNVVATCGTSLTRDHLRVLKRYTRRIVLVYDGDSAGIKAAERSLGLFLEEDLWPFFVPLPAGKDPDDVVRDEGGEAFQERVRQAVPLLEHLIRRQALAARASAMDQEAALEELKPLFSLFGKSRPEKLEYYHSYVARHFGLPDHVVRDTFRRARQERQQRVLDGAPAAPPARPPLAVLPVHEAFLLHWILQRPAEILGPAEDARIADWLTHPGIKRIVTAAIEAHRAGAPVDYTALVDYETDPGLKDKIAELCVKELPLGDEDLERGAIEQTLLGIKLKNMNHVARRLQGEIARISDEGGDQALLARLLSRKVELNKEMDLLRRRTCGSHPGEGAVHPA